MKTMFRILSALLAKVCLLAFVGTAYADVPPQIKIERIQRVTSYGEETVTEYFYDEMLEHEDGIIEVYGRAVTAGEENKVRWLYTSGGKMIGRREYSDGTSSDSLSYFDSLDSSLNTFIANLPDVESVAGNIIFLKDETRIVATMKGSTIWKLVYYYPSGAVSEITLDDDGLLQELKYYDDVHVSMSPSLHVQMEYMQLPTGVE